MKLYIYEGSKKTILKLKTDDPDIVLEHARQHARSRGKIVRDFDTRYVRFINGFKPTICVATIS